MAAIIASILIATVILSFLPTGQRFMERMTRGFLKPGAMPWVGIATTFMWTYAVMPSNHARGGAFGVLILAIAIALKYWAPRNQEVKSFIKAAFFAGRDIWNKPNFNLTVGALLGAGIILVAPIGGLDRALNFFGLMSALAWLAWQAYKGEETADVTNETARPDVDSATEGA